MYSVALNALGVASQPRFRGATLSLDFANTGALDSRVTFTRNSAATYFNSSGTLTSASANTPRFDYDPVTRLARGLLIEEQRTNLLTYSEQFDNALWVKGGSTISANAVVSLDGTQDADKLVEDTSLANFHRVSNVSLSGINLTTQLTVTFYVKAAERNRFNIYIFNNGAVANFIQGTFNLSTLASSATNGGTGNSAAVSITDSGNGCYRCRLSGIVDPAVTSGVPNVQLRMLNASGSEAYNGDGTSGLYIWGAQLEAGAFATSYIPTTTAQVTRIADSATMTGTNFSSWYNATEGTLFADFDVSVTTTDSNTRVIYGVSNGAFANSMYLTRQPSSNQISSAVIFGGAAQDTAAAIALPANNSGRHAFGYATDNLGHSLNGSAVTLDTTASIPSVNGLTLGNANWSGGANLLCGHIKRISYYPRRLSNAELQAITS